LFVIDFIVCFLKDIPTNVFGSILQKQVEDRLTFYDNGTLPPKNVEIMKGAVLKAEEAKNEILKKEKKKRKKEKKRKEANGDNEQEEAKENGDAKMEDLSTLEDLSLSKKKKKKRAKTE
jgi:nucleolar protein 56